MRLGLLSRWWGTFNQWHQIGCTIRKRPANVEEGHWGCRVVFWKPLTKTVVDDQTGDEEDEERFFILQDLHGLLCRPSGGGGGCGVPGSMRTMVSRPMPNPTSPPPKS